MEQQTVNPKCPNCGEDMVFNPRTGKTFCSAKCWLGAPNKNVNGFVKTSPYPQTQQVVKQGYSNKSDPMSFYVAYAKDLCIAMLQAHVEARKIDNKIEPLAIKDLMSAAVDAVKSARKEFEQ